MAKLIFYPLEAQGWRRVRNAIVLAHRRGDTSVFLAGAGLEAAEDVNLTDPDGGVAGADAEDRGPSTGASDPLGQACRLTTAKGEYRFASACPASSGCASTRSCDTRSLEKSGNHPGGSTDVEGVRPEP
ncbi:hypothetical protein ACFWBC_39715, partial [Streptomyces sp. NPDC059985]